MINAVAHFSDSKIKVLLKRVMPSPPSRAMLSLAAESSLTFSTSWIASGYRRTSLVTQAYCQYVTSTALCRFYKDPKSMQKLLIRASSMDAL